jgi:phage shock protein PspC (stress-responsive transcriptional regulator)
MANNIKRIHKSRNNRVFWGICGGIGEYVGIDPVFVRAIFIVGSFLSGGTLFFAYILLGLVIPAPLDSWQLDPNYYPPKNRAKGKTVEVPVRGKRKNDHDPLHYARPIRDIEDLQEKAKRRND